MRLGSLFLVACLAIFSANSAHAQAANTIRDCSISSLSGSSQTLALANLQRKYLFIFNSGANNAYVNLSGGTAATSGVSSIVLVPGASLEYPKSGGSNIIPGNAITVIGTAAQPIECSEGR